ncbi:MAG: hypothetical protein GXC70_09830 [Sphingomonadaceae bacterium]|nr:hypothetical protein [Sphingomonadaceae bacterium]
MKQPQRRAIVDIGSNSIRLVVFGGTRRNSKVLYDDKLMAGLGRGVVARGRLDRRSMAEALQALSRFAALIRLIEPDSLQVVATAAVRDAANGPAFLDKVRALGLPVRLLSGEDEARASAWGVIASHPLASGLVADLGGGSLELARIEQDRVHECVSFRLGIMPVGAIRAEGRGNLRRTLRGLLEPHSWTRLGHDRQLLLVGGAWRALDKVRVHSLGGTRGEPFPASHARQLKAMVRELGPRRLAAMPGVSSARAAQLGDASALLWALVAETAPAQVLVSGAGLREGLLFKGG